MQIVITYASDSSTALAEEWVSKITEVGNGSDAIKAQAAARLNPLTRLVSNAGLAHIKSVVDSTAEAFDSTSLLAYWANPRVGFSSYNRGISCLRKYYAGRNCASLCARILLIFATFFKNSFFDLRIHES